MNLAHKGALGMLVLTHFFPRMSRFLLLALFAFVLTACAEVDDAPIAETSDADVASSETPMFTGTALALDTTASSIEWQAAKVTRTHDGGFNRFEGMVYLDGETLTGVEVQIDPASIFSDSERLTGHLMSDDFFDVATFQEASFQAMSFEPIAAADSVEWADATHRVMGTLTMHGQSRQVTFPARVEVTPEAVRADSEFLINRQEWGLSYPGAPDDLIQDEVQIKLNVVAPRMMATEGENAEAATS